MTRIGLAVASVLLTAAAAQAKLEIQNVHASYSLFGPERKSLDAYPGDEVLIRFTVRGAKLDKDGRVDATMTLKLVNANGDVLVSQDVPLKPVLALSLGGDSFPSHARINMGEKIAPGEYTLTLTVTDKASGEKASFQQKINCKPVELALVAPEFSYDPEGKVLAPAGGVVGQVLFFRMRGVGIDRTQEKIDTTMKTEVLDAKGKLVIPKPITADIKNDDAEVVRKVSFVTYRGQVVLNRPGEVTLRVSVIDNIAKKTATFEVPLRVTNP